MNKVLIKSEHEIQLELAKITDNLNAEMKRMYKKQKKKRFEEEEKAINDIFNKWDPIPYAPEDEYDCLTHQIINTLYRGIG